MVGAFWGCWELGARVHDINDDVFFDMRWHDYLFALPRRFKIFAS